MYVYLNGDYIQHEDALIHVEDRGFNFADSLYEVTRIYNGRPFGLNRHISRMEQGAELLQLEYGITTEQFTGIVDELIRINETPEASLYIQVSRGVAPRDHPFPPEPTEPTVFVMVKPHEPVPWEERLQGKTAITEPDMRYQLCAVKTTALLPNVLACQKARSAGAFEAILVRDGMVTEGSNTNIYIVNEGTIRTFPLVNILPGITRSYVQEICEHAGIPFLEEAFSVGAMLEADEVFLTGSVAEIFPVVQIDDQHISQGAGVITRQLIERYAEAVTARCGQYTPER